MLDRALAIYRGGVAERQTLGDAATYAATVRTLFRIALSDEEAARLPLFSND
jgi:hypothetical protein